MRPERFTAVVDIGVNPKHLALFAHHCYGSYDLAACCIHVLAEGGTIAADGLAQYLAIVQKK